MSFGRSGSKPAAASSSADARHHAAAAPGGDGLYRSRIGKQAETDRDAVPAIDDIDHQRELDLLLLGELGLQGFTGTFQLVSFGEPRQRLGPAERGAFAIGIAGGLPPGRQQVDALLGLSFRARVRCMHIDAVGAAVDLGGTDLHEMHEVRFKARGDGERCVEPVLHQRQGRRRRDQFWQSWLVSFCWFRHHDEAEAASVTSHAEILGVYRQSRRAALWCSIRFHAGRTVNLTAAQLPENGAKNALQRHP